MCFVAAVPIAMMVASAAMAGINASQQAKAKNKQAEYNAQVATNNAANARQEGDYSQAQALRNANEKRKETHTLIGAQRARQGASGVVVDAGSASDVVLDTVDRGEREAMALLQQGDVEAWRTESQARGYTQEAKLANSSKVSVGAAVTGSVLSSAVSSGSKYFSLGAGA